MAKKNKKITRPDFEALRTKGKINQSAYAQLTNWYDKEIQEVANAVVVGSPMAMNKNGTWDQRQARGNDLASGLLIFVTSITVRDGKDIIQDVLSKVSPNTIDEADALEELQQLFDSLP